MGALVVRVCNALRKPLDDQMDVFVVSAATDATAGLAKGVPGNAAVRFERLLEGQPYLVRVFSKRHRPVSQFVSAGPDANPRVVQLFCPIDPGKVQTERFPDYAALDVKLQAVIETSTIAGIPGQGEAIYKQLTKRQKAGLLNLFTKMSSVVFRVAGNAAAGAPLAGEDTRSTWSFVDRLFGIREDRIFIDVQPELRDLAHASLTTDLFREVSGSLHEPPSGFGQAGSFKTSDPYGNLQLTFFRSETPPLRYKVDADIDDAAGLEHAFQVIRNFVTHGTTHPYDIHEILAYRQQAPLPYDLA